MRTFSKKSTAMLASTLLFLLTLNFLGYFSFQENATVLNKPGSKVPVDLFVMSKCPDAVFCESVFEQVMRRVGSKAEINLNFIGTIDSSASKYGVTCMHGESECLGNIQELCAKKVSPATYFGFTLCLNKDPSSIGRSDKALTQCLAKAQIPLAQFRTCVNRDGSQLLKDSVTYTKNQQMRSSCTILINKQNKCIHDGIWKNCDGGHSVSDFARQIEKAYNQS